MLNTEDRVRRIGFENYTDVLGTVGTVTVKSPFGYIKVRWDNGIEDRYPPMLVSERIEKVMGDDALPRHTWDLDDETDNPPCLVCRVIQTEDNELGACRGVNEV